MTTRTAVLGGGVAGVVAAFELASRGGSVDLFEKENRLGGLHHSIPMAGRVFDIGAFVFADQHELIRTFPFLKPEFTRVEWTSISIRPDGSIDRFPISVGGYARYVGPWGAVGALADLFASKLRYRRRDSVPAFAKYYMGDQVYRRSGLKHYIERLHEMPDDEVGMEFALQRLSEIHTFTVSRLARRFARDAWNRVAGSPSPQALVRPQQGFELVYERIREALVRAGVRIHLNRSVRSIERQAGGFRVDLGEESASFDHVVSTIPVAVALRLLGLTPRARFDSTNLYSLFYEGQLRHPQVLQHNFTLTGRWKRLLAASAVYGRHNGCDYWTVEVTTKDASAGTLETLRRDFESHGRAHELFSGTPIYLGGHVTPHAYPVFHRGESAQLQAERDRLTESGIHFVGRQGAFEYLSSGAAAARAKEIARRLSGPGSPA